MLRTGIAVDARYELGRLLGRGGMSEVWSARDLASGEALALKFPRREMRSPEVLARFEQEGEVMARFDSPFICPCFGTGRMEDGTPYLVFERLYGQTLSDRLRKEQSLSMEDAAWVIDHILEGLVCAHAAGVIHRDLNPANVFLEETASGKLRAKLLDFGVAKVKNPRVPLDKSATGSFATIGTVAYAAPEQLGEAGTVNARADLYAVGTVLFRALSGRLPFGDASGPALTALKREHDAPSIDEATGEKWPIAISGFLRRMLARLPTKRYPSAEITLAGWRAACATLSGMTPQYEPGPAEKEKDTLTINPSSRQRRRP